MPPRRDSTAANVVEMPASVQRSGGTVIYNLRTQQADATTKAPSKEPRVTLPALALLSTTQIRSLCKLAQGAYSAQVAAGREPTPDKGTKTAMQDAWRRGQQVAVGAPDSLKACTQEHYNTLVQHFASLCPGANDAGRSFEAGMKLGSETAYRQMILAKIQKESGPRGLAYPAYAEAICRAQFKTDLGHATPKQLWCLFYTIKNRRAKTPATTPRPESPAADPRVPLNSPAAEIPPTDPAEYDAPF